MPRTTTGEIVRMHGKDPRGFKPLECVKSTPLPVPIWEQFQGASPRGKGFVRMLVCKLQDGVAILELLETGLRTDVWDVRIKFASRCVKLKAEIKGEDTAKFKAAYIAREHLLRAAYCADEVVNNSIPF